MPYEQQLDFVAKMKVPWAAWARVGLLVVVK